MTDDELVAVFDEHAAAGVPCIPVAVERTGADAEGHVLLAKRPLTPHGHLDATTDRATFLGQLTAARSAAAGRFDGGELAIGGRPGSGGYAVLDCDVKHGACGLDTLERLRAVHGDDIAAVCWTSPSGGVNVVVRKPDGDTYGNANDLPGIDLRADSGWVVLPGSVTSWGSWSWRSGEWADAAVAPDELVAHFGTAEAHAGAVDVTELDAFLDADNLTTPTAWGVFEQRERALADAAVKGSRHLDYLVPILGFAFGMRLLDQRRAFELVARRWSKLLEPSERRREHEPLEVACWVLGQEQRRRAAEDPTTITGDTVPPPPPPPPTAPPQVLVSGRHLGDYVDEVVAGLAATNEPMTLFAHADGVSELTRGQLRPLDAKALLDVVERRLRIVRVSDKGVVAPAVLAAQALQVALRRLPPELPALEHLVNAPFMRADGTICQTVGYDPASRLYLTDDVAVDVPDSPTARHVRAAVELLDDLIVDFPLAGKADRAHVLALFVTATVRPLVPLVPLFAISGNVAGVGKGKLARVVLTPQVGDRAAATRALSLDGEEQRKAITTALAAGDDLIVWDEAPVLKGRGLAQLLTTERWTDRVLGSNLQITAANRLTPVALGNNMRIVGDLQRRVVLIRLETDLERPGLRQGFRHRHLERYADSCRGDLLSAVLTLLRAWHHAGRPEGDKVLGSFERWSYLVGGVLELAGVEGFLGNTDDVFDDDDVDNEMVAHLVSLQAIYDTVEFGVRDVLDACRLGRCEPPPRVHLADADAAGQLGRVYRSYRGRLLGGLRLRRRGVTDGRTRWDVHVK